MFGFAAGVFVEYDSLLVSSKLEFDQEKKKLKILDILKLFNINGHPS